MLLPHYKTGRDSSVGIATRYGLDCTGIEVRDRVLMIVNEDVEW
jgi:hypothetical protein